MNQYVVQNVSRRNFLKLGVFSGLGLTLGLQLNATAEKAGPGLAAQENLKPILEPNAFVRIGTDDQVTVIAKHLEMGQGSHTGLATLLAEELDARWSQIEIIAAPADADRYNNLMWGPTQGTGGSTSIANAYEQMRKAGAAARRMLVQAAAKTWGVDEDTLEVQEGVVRHPPSERKASFGQLAESAAQLPVPDEVQLKDPQAFRLIGKGVPRKDVIAKTDGTAVFTQDVERPGMWTAVVAHPLRFGAKLSSFDAGAALKSPGVFEVVAIPSGVAVLAEHYWAALKGRELLQIEWDERDAMQQGSAEVLAAYRKRLDQPGLPAREVGEADDELAKAAQVIRADFQVPFLAHAALEPMNCVIEQRADGVVELWYGAQLHTGDQAAVADIFGIEPGQVHIHTLFAGGSFGRRANPASDYVRETAHIMKAIKGKAPVKLVWSREDDMRAGWYRPAFAHRLEATLDASGMPLAWRNRVCGQSIAKGTPFETLMVKDGVDQLSVEGASNLPYAIPHLKVELHTAELPVPLQWWRAVGSTHTAFAVETFIDILARAAGQDAVSYRRKLLEAHPRHLAALDAAVNNSRWGQALEGRRGRGVAVHESFNSVVAMVAEVRVADDNSYRVERVDVGVDCGIAVNPDIVRTQVEGGLGFGLSAVIGSELTLEKGAPVQSNFHDYAVLRMDGMPEVNVHIVPSTEPPTGIGEPATPVIAPAVANALMAVTGKRYLELPIRRA